MFDKFLQGGNALAYLPYLVLNFFLLLQINILSINRTTEFLGTKGLQETISFFTLPQGRISSA